MAQDYVEAANRANTQHINPTDLSAMRRHVCLRIMLNRIDPDERANQLLFR